MLDGTEFQYNLTRNNYLKYRVSGEAQKSLSVSMGVFKSDDLSFKSHCLQAADQIAQQWPTPVLALSGGIDSQAMVLSFLAAGQPFEIAIFRYYDDRHETLFNSYDVIQAHQFIQKYGLENDVRYIDINLDEFYRDQIHQAYAEKYRCSSPQLTVHMKALDLIDAPVVLSWNIPNIFTIQERKHILVPNMKYFSFHRHLIGENKPGISYFFLYSPEQFYSSLLLSPIANHLFGPMQKNFIMTYESKVAAYREAGFQVSNDLQKQTGFELYKEHYRKMQNSQFGDQYERDLRIPFEEKFHDPSQIRVLMDAEFFERHANHARLP